jgi:uncharacterized protein YjbI with pentapeptide repeats
MPSFEGKTIVNCDLTGHALDFPVDFSGAIFTGPAVFKNVGFRAGATFTGTTFQGVADFSTCRFADYAYFWNCIFESTASFFRATFEPLAGKVEGLRHPGECNFSYTSFKGDVTFARARFGGLTYFHRTTFELHADFAEARFDKEVRFAGWQNDICVRSRDIPPNCKEYMRQQGLLCDCADNQDYVNFDLRIQGAKWLEDELRNPGIKRAPLPKPRLYRSKSTPPPQTSNGLKIKVLNIDEINKTVSLYRSRYETPMFSTRHEVLFRGVTVVEKAYFSGVCLARCRFQGCNIINFTFEDVSWEHRRTTLRLSTRRAVRDEETTYSSPHFFEQGNLRRDGAVYEEVTRPLSADEYVSLARLYRSLRRKAENDGELEVAQDFYYGELEMSYRSRSKAKRWGRLIWLYRYTSGYGKQHSLCAGWLMLFILVIFPALYYSIGIHMQRNSKDSNHSALSMKARWRTFLSAEAHSLEASTLLPAQGHDLGVYGDLVNGIERVIVPLQAGLLALSVRYNFQHKIGD